MNLFSNMRLRWKLLTAFGAVCAVMAVVGLVGINTAQRIKGDLDDVAANNLPSVVAIGQTQSNVLIAQRSIRSAILADDSKEIQGYLDEGQRALDSADKALATYTAFPLSDQEKQLVGPVANALKSLHGFYTQAAPLALANTPESQRQANDIILKQAVANATVLNDGLSQLVAINQQQSAESLQSAATSYEQSLRILVGSVVGGIVLALALGL